MKTETIGEAAMSVLRGHGKDGATAAEIAAALRAGSIFRPRMPEASTPIVADRLRKYARRGAVRAEYVTTREGGESGPAEQEERFFS